MRIAKPILLVGTPIGVAGGLYEAWHLAGGLVFLMAMLVALVGTALASVVLTVRREQQAEAREARGVAAAATGEGHEAP